MANDDDVDFDALMRSDGVQRLGSSQEPPSRPQAGRRSPRPERSLSAAEVIRGRPRARPATSTKAPPARVDRSEHDPTRAALDAAHAERDQARAALDAAHAERDQARAALDAAHSQLEALRSALRVAMAEREQAREDLSGATQELRRYRSAPAAPSLRAALTRRGLIGPSEAIDVLLGVLGRGPAELLDGLTIGPELATTLETRLALVCTGDECQPTGASTVVHVPPERCEVCGGSNTRAAFESLLRASRIAGITRLVVVGGSPPYHAQLRTLSRGTDLKLDLVSGRSKPGRRRARSDVERVVIWGASILDHGTSAAYDHLGSRIIRVTHRGISTMLREVAAALRVTALD